MRLKITKFILFSCVIAPLFLQCMTKSKVAQAERKKEKIEQQEQKRYEEARKESRKRHLQQQTPEVKKRIERQEKEAKKRMRKQKRTSWWKKLFGKRKAKN